KTRYRHCKILRTGNAAPVQRVCFYVHFQNAPKHPRRSRRCVSSTMFISINGVVTYIFQGFVMDWVIVCAFLWDLFTNNENDSRTLTEIHLMVMIFIIFTVTIFLAVFGRAITLPKDERNTAGCF